MAFSSGLLHLILTRRGALYHVNAISEQRWSVQSSRFTRAQGARKQRVWADRGARNIHRASVACSSPVSRESQEHIHPLSAPKLSFN